MGYEGAPKTTLYVEPDLEMRDRISRHLADMQGVHLEIAHSLKDSTTWLSKKSFDIVIAGCGLSYEEKAKLHDRVTSSLPESAFLVIVKAGSEKEAISFMMRGASGCVIDDEEFSSSFKVAFQKAVESVSLIRAQAVLESERVQLLSILNSLDVPAYVTDPDTYEVLFANKILIEELGEVLGKKCYEAFQGLAAPCPFCTNRYIFGDNLGRTHIWEFQNLNTLKWYRCIDKAIRWPDGRMVRSEIAIDITDIREAQGKLSFQARLLDACEEAVIATDLEGYVTYLNHYAEFIFGISPEDVLGSDIFTHLPAKNLKERKEEILEIIGQGESWSGEIRVQKNDNSFLFTYARISPIYGEGSQVVGAVWIVQDISERKKTEQALRNIINETNERRQEITALLESSRLILEHKDFEEAARRVFEICRRLLKASGGFISLVDDEKVNIIFSSTGSDKSVGETSLMQFVNILFEKLRLSGKTLLINNIGSSEFALKEHLAVPARNILLAALKENGKVAGSMCLVDKEGGFSKRDVLLVEAFCEILSLALKSSRSLQLLSISEARHRQLIEKVPDVIYQISSEGIITELSPAFETITGWRISDWVGKPWEGIFHPEDISEAALAFQSAIAGREYPRFEARIPKLSGEYVTCEFTITPFYKEGRIVGILGVARDVTERVMRENEIMRTRELYKTFLDLSPDAVFITDNNGKIIEASEKAADILKCGSAEDLRKMNVYDLAAPGERELLKTALSDFERTASSQALEVAFVKRDGSIFYGEVRASTLKNEDGSTRGFIIDLRDITDRRAQQEEIQRINLELEGYAHAVSHDLRGPLANVVAGCEALEILLMRHGKVMEDKDIKGLIDMIKGNAEKCDLLIGDILLLAESGQRPENITDVNIDEVVGEIITEAAKEIEEKRISVKIETPLGTVKANRTHIYQLFVNLIRNALAHAFHPNLQIEISRMPSEFEGGHRFLVRDNGKGIPEDILEQIFKPYFTTQSNSSGLGLAIVSKIVKAYSGTIKAYNDGGACFDLTIFDAD